MGTLAYPWIPDAVDDLSSAFLITDPTAADHPIVFASRGFCSLTGYASLDVIGRNARLFQGPGTDRRSVMQIREAIRDERELQISILNYRKDGQPHWIVFHLRPLFGDDDGRVVHFVAVQVPIPCKERRSVVVGTCRDEVMADEGCVAVNRGLEVEEYREAGEWEKKKAASAVEEVVAAMARYSKFTGRSVSGKRCRATAPLSSSLTISLGRIKQSFVLTDPHLPDMPIVYASAGFLCLTGYSNHEVLGRNCRFLSGPGTDTKSICQMRNSLQAQQACTVRLLNYRKDGSSFWNVLHISPVRSASGKIAFYVGVQMDVDSESNGHGLSLEMRQLGAVGAVKVAVRSLCARIDTSRSS